MKTVLHWISTTKGLVLVSSRSGVQCRSDRCFSMLLSRADWGCSPLRYPQCRCWFLNFCILGCMSVTGHLTIGVLTTSLSPPALSPFGALTTRLFHHSAFSPLGALTTGSFTTFTTFSCLILEIPQGTVETATPDLMAITAVFQRGKYRVSRVIASYCNVTIFRAKYILFYSSQTVYLFAQCFGTNC